MPALTKTLNLDSFTMTAALFVERTKEGEKATLAAITLALQGVATEKEAASVHRHAADNQTPALWTNINALGRRVFEAEEMQDFDTKQRHMVFNALLLDASKGLGEVAHKTLKTYSSTVGKVMEAAASGALNWHQTETKLVPQGDNGMVPQPVSHEEVREMLKSSDQIKLEEIAAEVATKLRKIKGREGDTRSVESRRKGLEKALKAISEILAEVGEPKGKGKGDSANSLREAAANTINHPTTPTTVEIARAAAAAVSPDEEESGGAEEPRAA